MPGETALFPASYEVSRRRFRASLERVQRLWPAAKHVCHTLDPVEDDLTLDWIEAGALQSPEKVLLFTLGEHGIEGFVGSAMLELFIEEFLPNLDPNTTGLLLVHAINPWGMKHRRRTNAHNVDLNRNFVRDENDLDPGLNLNYARINRFLNPGGPAGSPAERIAGFGVKLVGAIASLGLSKFRQAVLLGQYEFTEGIYFGGKTLQPETRLIMELFRGAVANYARSLLLDMHTGYGPRSRMSLVNSVHEARTSSELKRIFGYPDVVKSNPAEFYAIQGDMIDYIYTLVQKEFPGKQLYATSFEFGTFGDSFGAVLRSLRTMIDENRMRRFGTFNERQKTAVLNEFTEMFFPQAADWQIQAVNNARAAFAGILQAEGYKITSS